MNTSLGCRSEVQLPRWLFVTGLALLVTGIGMALALRLMPAPVGTVINPARAMPDFEMRNQNNAVVHLRDLKGQPVLMIFGYTHCPDICPLGLVDFKKVKANLGKQAERVAFVFISIDGDRDTPAVLKQYMAAFDTQFIGLTERPFVVSQIAASYGAKFMRRITSTAQTTYLMSHTTDTYLLDQRGYLRKVYPYAAPTEAIAQDVRSMLGEAPGE